MMANSVSLTDTRNGPMAASWLVSCLLHGGLAIAAIFFVQRMQLAPQTAPFQWDVAMVATLSSSARSASPSESTAPSTTTLRQSAPRVTDAHQAVRPVQPRITTPVTPPAPVTEFTPEPHQAQPLLSESHSQGLTSSVPADLPSQNALQHLSAPLAEPVAPAHSPLPSSASTNASTASTDQLKSTKADYGWLTELMARWIEDLNKRYPATLRTEGIQGKVMLTAMLHENGLLSDVGVVKSSGNAALDEVALEDVRNGPPINLSRPLERAHMPVKFSISYDLKRVR